MFLLCCVPFHLTVSFPTIPRGPESGVLVLHVTVIIFLNRDTDMDSLSAKSLSYFPQLWYCWGLCVCLWNEFTQSKVQCCVQLHPNTPNHMCTPKAHASQIHTHACAHKKTAVFRQSREKITSFVFRECFCCSKHRMMLKKSGIFSFIATVFMTLTQRLLLLFTRTHALSYFFVEFSLTGKLHLQAICWKSLRYCVYIYIWGRKRKLQPLSPGPTISVGLESVH